MRENSAFDKFLHQRTIPFSRYSEDFGEIFDICEMQKNTACPALCMTYMSNDVDDNEIQFLSNNHDIFADLVALLMPT